MRAIAILFCLVISGVACALLIWQGQLVPYSGSDAYYRQPGFFPTVSLVAVILFGVVLAVRYGLGQPIPEDEELAGTKPQFKVLVPLSIGFAVYALLTPLIGYLASSLAFSVSALAIGRRSDVKSVAVIVAFCIGLFLAFVTYLDVWFPEPSVLDMWRQNK